MTTNVIRITVIAHPILGYASLSVMILARSAIYLRCYPWNLPNSDAEAKFTTNQAVDQQIYITFSIITVWHGSATLL